MVLVVLNRRSRKSCLGSVRLLEGVRYRRAVVADRRHDDVRHDFLPLTLNVIISAQRGPVMRVRLLRVPNLVFLYSQESCLISRFNS